MIVHCMQKIILAILFICVQVAKFEKDGKVGKAAQIVQTNAWDSAFKKAEGKKVSLDFCVFI